MLEVDESASGGRKEGDESTIVGVKRKLEQAGKVPPVQPALAPDAARAAVAAGATGATCGDPSAHARPRSAASALLVYHVVPLLASVCIMPWRCVLVVNNKVRY